MRNGEPNWYVYYSKCGYQDARESNHVHVGKEYKSATNTKANNTKFTSHNNRCIKIVKAVKSSMSRNNEKVLDYVDAEADADAAK